MAPFGDILSALENARQAAWAERSPMNPAGGSGSSGSGSGVSGIATQRLHGHRGNSSRGGHLPNSHSQPIYVPGKYSVCILEPYRYTSPHHPHRKSNCIDIHSIPFYPTTTTYTKTITHSR